MLWDISRSRPFPLSFAINTFIVFAQIKETLSFLAKLFFCNLLTPYLHTLKTAHLHIIINSCNQLITLSYTSQEVSSLVVQPKAHRHWNTNNRVPAVQNFQTTLSWSFNSNAFKSYGQSHIIIVIERERERPKESDRERMSRPQPVS